MAQTGKFYRSSDGITGVCAGIAEHYGVDALPVRLLFVMLFAMSLGLFGIVYLFLMLCWPRKGAPGGIYEVKPHAVDSTAFGSLADEDIRRMSRGRGHHRADAPLSVGHIPPPPPAAFVERYGTEGAPYFRFRAQGAAVLAGEAGSLRGDHRARRQEGRRMSGHAAIMLVAAVFVLSALCDVVAGQCVHTLPAHAALPNFFVILGICLIVVPQSSLPLAGRLANGAALIALGLVLLSMSCGALSWQVLVRPQVICVLGAMVLACLASLRWRKPALFALIGALVLLLLYAAFIQDPVPGPLDTVQIWQPFFGWGSFDVNPWR